MMPLVEVVRAITTSDETVQDAGAFAERCGKTASTFATRPGSS